MANPESSPMQEDEALERSQFRQFVAQHKRFVNNKREYTQQFSHLYYTRLAEIQKELTTVCLEKWKNSTITTMSRVLDIQPGVPCIVSGTLYKEMALKPNFLVDYLQNVAGAGDGDDDDEGSNDGGEGMVTNQPVTYQSAGDQLILEDESGRMTLEGAALPPQLVTGVIIGVKGSWKKDANFEVEDICVCGFPRQKVSIKSCVRPDTGPLYLALMSGLNVGSPKLNPLALQLVLDFISGNVGDPDIASRIARVVVAGDSIYPTEDIKSRDKIQLHTLAAESTTLVDPMKEADLYFAELCSTCPTDIMPGDNDPSNCFLPQQPIHPCLLPHTSKHASVSFTTNPYQALINGMTVLGTSGQNVTDIDKYASFDNPIDILESSLNWRNLAPTAPDTLAVYPFIEHDPFNMMECPHVYFAGNQPKFQTKLTTGPDGQSCRLVCIPAFSEKPCITLVDMNSEDLNTITVDISTLDALS